MKGTYAGLGVVFGAALGLLTGVLVDKLVFGILIGAGLGLLAGAVLENNQSEPK